MLSERSSSKSMAMPASLAAAAALIPGVEVNLASHDQVTVSKPAASKRTPANRNPSNQAQSLMDALLGDGGRFRIRSQRRAGFGWTNAHAKRVAAKKRSVKAHRARSRA